MSTGISNYTKHLAHKHNKKLDTPIVHENQRLLTDVLFPSAKRPKNNETNNSQRDSDYVLARQIALWYCRDLVPFIQVQKDGFLDFMKYLNPKTSLPSRSTISISALDDIYACVKGKFIEKISNAPAHGTVTMDFWSDKHYHTAYVTYTYHFMDKWTIQSAVLKTACFDHPHTGARIKSDLENTLHEFGLSNKMITAVTDGGTSLINACNLMNIRRNGCINHAIHNLITTDLMGKKTPFAPLRDLMAKLRMTHYKLTYKHRELKVIDDELRQQKMLDVIQKYTEIRKF